MWRVALPFAPGLWDAARTVAGERTGAAGFTATAMVAVGLVAYVMGAVVVGSCLLLVALGLLTAAVSVMRERPPPSFGHAGWTTG